MKEDRPNPKPHFTAASVAETAGYITWLSLVTTAGSGIPKYLETKSKLGIKTAPITFKLSNVSLNPATFFTAARVAFLKNVALAKVAKSVNKEINTNTDSSKPKDAAVAGMYIFASGGVQAFVLSYPTNMKVLAVQRDHAKSSAKITLASWLETAKFCNVGLPAKSMQYGLEMGLYFGILCPMKAKLKAAIKNNKVMSKSELLSNYSGFIAATSSTIICSGILSLATNPFSYIHTQQVGSIKINLGRVTSSKTAYKIFIDAMKTSPGTLFTAGLLHKSVGAACGLAALQFADYTWEKMTGEDKEMNASI